MSTDRAAERDLRVPLHESGLTDRYEWPPAEPPATSPPSGVRLTRMIGLVGFTPAQAVEIGSELLAEVAKRSEPAADELRRDQIMIDTNGRVVLGGAPARGTDTTVDAVLADLLGAARRGSRRTDPTAGRLLAALERARAQLPAAGVPAAWRTLVDAAETIDRDAVRAELAALVAAVTGSPVAGRAPAAGTPHGAPVGRPRPARGGNRATLRRIGAWLLSIVVLVGVVLAEIAVLRDEIVADIDMLLDAGRSGAAPPAMRVPDGVPVVPPAPPAAGEVAGVDLRPLQRCTPGGPCPVRVLVQLTPGPDQRIVTWSLRIVDRCTGAAVPVGPGSGPGGSVTVPAGVEQAAAVGTVPLPALPAVAVLAVTDRPAVAAAEPLLVGSCRLD